MSLFQKTIKVIFLCLFVSPTYGNKCNIALHDFARKAVSMYGKPQPEKTLSLIKPSKGDILDRFRNQSYEAKIVDFRAPYRNVHRVHEEPSAEKRDLQTIGRRFKRGLLQFGQTGTFEGVNPFIAQGTAPFVLKDYLYDSMMYRSPAEPFTLYPQIVSVDDMAENRNYVTFKITEGAKFNDGSDITTKDIKFTFDLLKEKGRYNYRIAYKDVTTDILSAKKIRFNIHNGNRELPLILGLMPVLSHKNNVENFDKQLGTEPLGAGAYIIHKKKIGQNITLIRNENYYGEDRAISCLRFHFDKIKIDFFKNEQASFESFKAGESDFFYETDLTRLNRAYHFPAIENGDVIYHNVKTERPSGLYGFAFNTRRKPWDDVILRKVVSDIFAFDTLNKHYLYDTEKQIDSMFMGSDLAYNANHKKQEPEQSRREILTASFKTLKQAGYRFDQGDLISPEGHKITLNILLAKPRHEKYALLLRWMLKDIGITAEVQTSDDALYQKRVRAYDYDMIIDHRYVSLSPGTEQRNFWGCAGRTTHGTRNYAGICDKTIEQALNELDKARSSEDLKTSIHKIDGTIIEGHYYIPLESKRHYHLFTSKNIRPSAYGEKYFMNSADSNKK